MKKTYWMILAAGMMCLAACHTEQDFLESEQGQEAEMRTEVITATVADDATKATIADGGTFGWVGGTDMIAVHTTTGYVTSTAADETGPSASFSVTYPYSSTRDAYAIFPSYLVTPSAANYGQAGHTLDVTLPSTYTLAQVSDEATPCPMIATNTPGAGWSFTQLCGLLRLTVNGIPAGTSYLKLDFNGRQVSGGFSIASPYSTIASVDGTKGEDDFITITGITSETSVTVNIPLPTGVAYSDLVVSAWNSSDVALKAAVEPFSYTAAAAKGKKITSTLNKGVFSIASGKYAVFAPANLVATITEVDGEDVPIAATWTFAANQYTYERTTHEGVISEKTRTIQDFGVGDKIDLFGWSTSSTYRGINKSNVASGYYGDFVDWGDVESINGYAAGTWRTPTGGAVGTDWEYLLVTRANAASKIGFATVGGMSGLIILPDSFTDPETNGGSNPFVSGVVEYANNVYSVITDDWNKMESAGAIFLPAAGYRGSILSENVGKGSYWSSTSTHQDYGRNIAFQKDDPSSNLRTQNNQSRFRGLSVRLIRDLN